MSLYSDVHAALPWFFTTIETKPEAGSAEITPTLPPAQACAIKDILLVAEMKLLRKVTVSDPPTVILLVHEVTTPDCVSILHDVELPQRNGVLSVPVVTENVLLAERVVNLPVLALVAPTVIPLMAPPLMAAVVTVPRSRIDLPAKV